MSCSENAFVPEGQIELEAFRKLLVSVWESFDPLRNKSEQTLTTHFRPAVRIHDWLRYGHKKTPEFVDLDLGLRHSEHVFSLHAAA